MHMKNMVDARGREKYFCLCPYPLQKAFSSTTQREECSTAVHRLKENERMSTFPFQPHNSALINQPHNSAYHTQLLL